MWLTLEWGTQPKYWPFFTGLSENQILLKNLSPSKITCDFCKSLSYCWISWLKRFPSIIGLDSPHQKTSFPITAVLYLEYVWKPQLPPAAIPALDLPLAFEQGMRQWGQTGELLIFLQGWVWAHPAGAAFHQQLWGCKSTSFLKAEAISGLHRALVPWQPQSEPSGCFIPGFRQLQSFNSFPYKSSVSGSSMACSALSY